MTVKGPLTAMKSGPHLPQLEKALAQKQRTNTAQKIKNINKLIKIRMKYLGINLPKETKDLYAENTDERN